MVERRAVDGANSINGAVVGGAETLLVAKDDEMVRNMTVRILEKAGYTVLVAIDGEEALEVFKAHAGEISLALLDVVMPKLSGKQVYARIKESNPRVRILFSSGHSVNAVHINLILDEGTELIQKPYDPDALLRRVREMLDAPS